MAVLRKRGGAFCIDFRFAGQRFRQSLKTDDARAAKNALGRADEILRRLELGQLSLPPGADVATFVLSDGRLEEKPQQPAFATLGPLLDEFLNTLTPDALEATTEHCVRIHIRHFRRVIGDTNRLRSIDLQEYVDARAKDKGLRRKNLSATTIKKELGTLGMIWTWALAKGYVDQPLVKKGLRFPKTADKPPFQTMEDVHRKIAIGGLAAEGLRNCGIPCFSHCRRSKIS